VVAKEVVVLAMVVKVTALQVVEREAEVLSAVVGLVAVARVVAVLEGVVTDPAWSAVGGRAEVERALGTTEGALSEAGLVAVGSEMERVARAEVMMVDRMEGLATRVGVAMVARKDLSCPQRIGWRPRP